MEYRVVLGRFDVTNGHVRELDSAEKHVGRVHVREHVFFPRKKKNGNNYRPSKKVGPRNGPSNAERTIRDRSDVVGRAANGKKINLQMASERVGRKPTYRPTINQTVHSLGYGGIDVHEFLALGTVVHRRHGGQETPAVSALFRRNGDVQTTARGRRRRHVQAVRHSPSA